MNSHPLLLSTSFFFTSSPKSEESTIGERIRQNLSLRFYNSFLIMNWNYLDMSLCFL